MNIDNQVPTRTDIQTTLEELATKYGDNAQCYNIEEPVMVFPPRGHATHLAIMSALVANRYLRPEANAWSTYTTTTKFQHWADQQLH